MPTDTTYAGYVITRGGAVLLHLPADNPRGFVLLADDSWPPGFVAAGDWEPVADDDPRVTADDRGQYQQWLDESRAAAPRFAE